MGDVALAYARAKAKLLAPKYGDSTFAFVTKFFALRISESFKRYQSSTLHKYDLISCLGRSSPFQRSFIVRLMSRSESRFFIVSRLSKLFLPRAMPSSTFILRP